MCGAYATVLPDGAIINTAGGYQLSTADESDIVRFEHLISQASGAVTAGEARRASDLYRDALELWRGEPFGGCAGVDPLQARRTWLEELHSQAVEGHLDAELRLGHHGDLIGELEHHVQTAPLRERLWEMLALALYRSGRQADALRACRRARDRLVGELGLEPGARLAALERSILAQDPSLEGDASAMDPHRRTRTGSQRGRGHPNGPAPIRRRCSPVALQSSKRCAYGGSPTRRTVSPLSCSARQGSASQHSYRGSLTKWVPTAHGCSSAERPRAVDRYTSRCSACSVSSSPRRRMTR